MLTLTHPITLAIERGKLDWADFLSSKPREIWDIFERLRLMWAVGDKFTRKTMLADISAELERLDMARGKSAGKTSAKSNSWKDNILTIPMDGYTSADVRAHFGEVTSLMDAIDAVVQAGYKLSVTYNTANDNFIASLTGRIEGNPNFDKTISGFAMTWDMAVAVVLFKHFVICSEGVWAEYARQRNFGEIG
jgi:hypothetical protein